MSRSNLTKAGDDLQDPFHIGRVDREGSSTSASTKDDDKAREELQKLSEHRRLSAKLVWHGARRFSGGPKQFGDWLAPRLSEIRPGDPRAGLLDLQQLLAEAPSDEPAKGWHSFFQWLHTAWPNQLEQLSSMLVEGQESAMKQDEQERGLGPRRRSRGEGNDEDPHILTAELVRESARQFPGGPQEFIAWLRRRLAGSRAEELQVSIQQLKQHFIGIPVDDTKANQDKFAQWLKRAACQDIRALLELLIEAQRECIEDSSPRREVKSP